MLRVLHYIGALGLGGSQTYIMEIYRNIDRSRLQFDFVTFPGQKGPMYDEILSLGGKVYEFPKYNGLNHFKFTSCWKRFMKEHPEYTIVHCHVRSVASIYAPIVRKAGRYAIIHSHSTANGSGVAGFIKYLLQLPIGKCGDFYMGCSDDAGKWLFGEKVVSSDRYKTVFNGIDPDRFSFDPEAGKKVRDEYGIGDEFVIGNIGRFVEVKNHGFLLDVFKEISLMDGFEDSRLLLIGDGTDLEKMKHKAEMLGISDRVIFTGSRADTPAFYSAMDVFVFPSKWEGLGIVAIEAQCSGLPCVMSDVIPREADVVPELVTRIPLEDNAKTWAGRITEVCNNNSNQKRASHSGEITEAGYDAKKNAKWMADFYEQVNNRISNK